MFTCSICSKCVSSYLLLKRHVTTFHGDHNGENLVCKQSGCLRVFSSFHGLYRHIRQKHSCVKNKVNGCTRSVSESSCRISQNETVYGDVSLSVSQNESVSGEVSESVTPIHDNYPPSTFMCKQYAKPHLSRKDVDESIKKRDSQSVK